MICIKCKTEMKKGALASNGQAWMENPDQFVKRIATFNLSKPLSFVTAWNCPKCGYIELSTATK